MIRDILKELRMLQGLRWGKSDLKDSSGNEMTQCVKTLDPKPESYL